MTFEQIYETYFRDVYRYILGLSGDAHLAEEITADTLISVNLTWGWPLIYLTLAITFCQVTCKKEAIRATALALLLPFYAALPFLTQCAKLFTSIYIVDTTVLFVPAYHAPHFVISLLLSAAAICSVWHQMKQSKHVPPAA